MAVTNYSPLDDQIAKYKKNYYTPLPAKEMEPVIGREEQKDVKIVVEHKDLDQEIRPHLKVREEIVEVSPDLQTMGVQATPTTQFATHQQLQALIPDAEILKGLHQPPTSSFRWLAELALYILKRAHITLKTVHGKVMRIIKA